VLGTDSKKNQGYIDFESRFD